MSSKEDVVKRELAKGPIKEPVAFKTATRPESKKPESILIIMPKDEELFIAALSTVQRYQQDMKDREQHQRYYICSENKDLEFLLDCLYDHLKIDREEIGNHRFFDLVFEFDEVTAYSLSESTERHAATAFGIQIGSEPCSLPDLSLLNWPEVDSDLLLCNNIPQKLRDEVIEIINKRIPGSTILIENPPEHCKPLDRFNLVGRSKVVIGVRSFETYLACCHERKGVVEIYPPGVHRKWLSKWTHKKYQMIVGTPEAVSAELVWRGMEALWRIPTYQVPGVSQATVQR